MLIMKNTNAYEFCRLFIYSEVVARYAISKYCAQHNLIKPKIGDSWSETCPTEAREVSFEFGDQGDLWDGKSNKFISQSEIDDWKKFLLISKKHYQEFFDMTAEERSRLFVELKEVRSSEEFCQKLIQNQMNGVNHFENDHYGKRLLSLRRLSRMYVDDMFISLAGVSILEFIGSDIQFNFYQQYGPDGLKFNGQPNIYLSQEQMNFERKALGISQEEFDKFYMLDSGERCLLFETSLFY